MIKPEILDFNIDNLPYSSRKWKYLSSYRDDWSFLPLALKNRVAEQLMTADYLVTLEEWLKPSLTIEERQKVLLVQTLASIYEGVLSCLVTIKIKEDIAKNKGLKRIYDTSTFYGDKRTFKPSLDLAFDMNLINESWKQELIKILEIRNWVHLSNTEKPDMISWIMNKTCQEHREYLNKFREFIKIKFVQ